MRKTYESKRFQYDQVFLPGDFLTSSIYLNPRPRMLAFTTKFFGIFTSFFLSAGWLGRFKARNCLSRWRPRPATKAPTVSPPMVVSPFQGLSSSPLAQLLNEYSPEDVFTAHETGLFYRCLPQDAAQLAGKRCSRGQRANDRLTLLLAANLPGTRRLPLLVIARHRPRVRRLPVVLETNPEAWMTAAAFERWVRRLDVAMRQEGRRLALIVTDCMAHPSQEGLHAVRLFFLSPLTPFDAGIAHELKLRYRCRLLRSLLPHRDHSPSFRVELSDALCDLRAAWNDVPGETIAACFQRTGLGLDPTGLFPQQEGSELQFHELWHKVTDLQPAVGEATCANVYATVDAGLSAFKSAPDEFFDIVKREPSQEGKEEEEEKECTQPPPAAVRNAITTLRRFLLSSEGTESDFDVLASLENSIEASGKNLVQKKITDFFLTSNRPREYTS